MRKYVLICNNRRKKYCIIMILETSVFIVLMVEKHQKMQRKEQEKVDIMEVL